MREYNQVLPNKMSRILHKILQKQSYSLKALFFCLKGTLWSEHY